MVKVVTVINWIVICLLGALVVAETLFPAKGGDAAGRGIGLAIYYLAIIAVIVLLILNLLPYNWAKYTAFGLILLPVFLIKFDSAWKGLKPALFARKREKWFDDEQKQRIAEAIENGEVEKARKLIWQFDKADKEGLAELLGFAVADASHSFFRPQEKLACVRLLLKAGADVNAAGKEEDPLLFQPAQAGHAPLLRLLLEHGADPNARSYYFKRPALFEAIYAVKEAKETVQALLDAGADPNATIMDGDSVPVSALMYAAQCGRWNVCPLLVAKGADTGYKTPGGRSLRTLVAEADGSYTGDGYSSRGDFEEVKRLVQEKR